MKYVWAQDEWQATGAAVGVCHLWVVLRSLQLSQLEVTTLSPMAFLFGSKLWR